MKKSLKAVVLLTALAIVAAPALQAQARGGYLARKGFWGGLGLGYGSMGISCSFCGTDREGGLSGNLRLGGTLSPRLRLGIETNGFSKTVEGIDVMAGQLGIVANYYPSATGNLYVRVSGGFSQITLDDGTDEIKATGPGFGVGAGYDFFIGRSISLSPYFNYLVAMSGEAKVNGTGSGEDLKPNLWQVGVAIVLH